MTKLKIAIGSDHAGFELKQKLIEYLEKTGFLIQDFGTSGNGAVDYPDFIHPVATRVEKGNVDFGIVICGTGNGAAITANKHRQVRAALCWNPELATLAKQHNNANIISLPARFISFDEAKIIINAFISADFEGGRHLRRIKKIPLNPEII